MGDWIYYSSFMTAEQISNWILQAKDIRESPTLNERIQRSLKERRLTDLSKYLTNVKSRFFNSIIIGVFDGIPEWIEFNLEKGLEKFNFSDQHIENIEDSLGIMIFQGNEQMFAIDGQHRVEGIKEAYKNQKNSLLLDKDNSIFEDQFPVIFLAHLDNEAGKKRTRKLFSDINKNAKQVAKKEKNTFEWEEVNIKRLYKIVVDFYDFIIHDINEYKKFFIEKGITIREARKNNSHLLFRPIGLTLIAKLYVHFHKTNKLEYLKKHINKISFIFPESPYNKVLWNNGKMEAKEKSQNIAYHLSLYLLNVLPEDKLEILEQDYRQVTKVNNAKLPNKIVT